MVYGLFRVMVLGWFKSSWLWGGLSRRGAALPLRPLQLLSFHKLRNENNLGLSTKHQISNSVFLSQTEDSHTGLRINSHAILYHFTRNPNHNTR